MQHDKIAILFEFDNLIMWNQWFIMERLANSSLDCKLNINSLPCQLITNRNSSYKSTQWHAITP